MKASEVIKLLEAGINDHGDQEVYYKPSMLSELEFKVVSFKVKERSPLGDPIPRFVLE